MKKTLFFSVLACAAAVYAIPEIREGSVTMVQAKDRTVTIGYTLDNAPAIVTLEICTNGVPLTGALLRGKVAGDINRKVEPGPHVLTWRPSDDERIAGDRRWCEAAQAKVTAWPTNSPPTWMVVDLSDGSLDFYADKSWFPLPLTNDLYKTDKLVMRKVPAANVVTRIGSPNPVGNSSYQEYGRDGDGNTPNERPHPVMLTEDYYIGIYPFTQGQWKHLPNRTIKCGQGGCQSATNDVCPIANVRVKQDLRGSGKDNDEYRAKYFWPLAGHNVDPTSALGQLRTVAKGAVEFDLPTDAQWEIACRAGSPFAFNNGCNDYEDAEGVADVAWTSANATEGVAWAQVHPVGLKAPNAWDLYDMHGNVVESVLDMATSSSTNAFVNVTTLQVDPVGPDYSWEYPGTESGAEYCVGRGGSFNREPKLCRSAKRLLVRRWGSNVENGFRVACPAVIK